MCVSGKAAEKLDLMNIVDRSDCKTQIQPFHTTTFNTNTNLQMLIHEEFYVTQINV